LFFGVAAAIALPAIKLADGLFEMPNLGLTSSICVMTKSSNGIGFL
jgi:hypothetical protein